MTRDRGGGLGVLRQQRGRGSTVSETVDHPISTTSVRTYVMKAREDPDAPKVIAGIFSLYDMEIYALIDLVLFIPMFAPSICLIKCHQ